MSALVIVPNELSDAINVKLDEELKQWPDATGHDRDVLYHQVLAHYNEHGVLPDFTIVKAIPA